MSSTPSQPPTVHYPCLPPSCMPDVLRVRLLYAIGKHKQCAALCEELQHRAWHPIHKASLNYYQAICHEQIAFAAHRFSTSKLPLLRLATKSLQQALEQLSQSGLLREDGCVNTTGGNDVVNHLDSLPVLHEPPSPDLKNDPCEDLVVDSVENQTNTFVATVNHVPYSPTPPRIKSEDNVKDANDRYLLQPSGSPQTPTPGSSGRRRSRSKARLSESLSNSHMLAEDLVPSPLHANRKSMSARSPLQHETLPAMPYTPDSQPDKRKKLHINIPSRKSTVESLIAKFESSPYSPDSPLTPRYNRISRVFSIKSEDMLSAKYLSTESLTKCSGQLQSLRTHIADHVGAIEQSIENVTSAQRRHDNQRDRRLASFWSFEPILNTSSSGRSPERVKADRVTRLKASGWVVTKEKHGWKGQAYYEALRQRALADIL